MGIRAVVFDLDCTLTCRQRSVRKGAERFAELFEQELGQVSAADVFAAMWAADHWGYRDRREFFAEVLDALHWRQLPEMSRLLGFWFEEFPQCAVEADGASPLLRRLRQKGLRLGIITNGNAITQNGKIDVLGFRSLLDIALVSGALGIHKPDGRIFHQAARELGVKAEECLFVGDHPTNDVMGALAAGMQAVWVRGTSPWPDVHAQPAQAIDGLAQLESLIPVIQRYAKSYRPNQLVDRRL